MEEKNTGTQPNQGPSPAEGEKLMLPNSTAVLVLGIVSIVGVLCSQGILGVILGIIVSAVFGVYTTIFLVVSYSNLESNPDAQPDATV